MIMMIMMIPKFNDAVDTFWSRIEDWQSKGNNVLIPGVRQRSVRDNPLPSPDDLGRVRAQVHI
jgi:hypothetical protein